MKCKRVLDKQTEQAHHAQDKSGGIECGPYGWVEGLYWSQCVYKPMLSLFLLIPIKLVNGISTAKEPYAKERIYPSPFLSSLLIEQKATWRRSPELVPDALSTGEVLAFATSHR